MKQVEDMRKELQSSWKASSDAASRAAVAEVRSNKFIPSL
jgi:nucleoprotein TPR